MRHLNLRMLLVRPAVSIWAAIALLMASAVAAPLIGAAPSYVRGFGWALSLITTEGFVGARPHSAAAWALSASLMISGMLLVTAVSATFASVLVQRREQTPFNEARQSDAHLEELLGSMDRRLAHLEAISNRHA